MALKYRIVYNSCPRYEKNYKIKRIPIHLLAITLVIILGFFLTCSADRLKLYEIMLPGDPVVTTNALHQFSDAVDQGMSLSEALDAFCSTIMNDQ